MDARATRPPRPGSPAVLEKVLLQLGSSAVDPGMVIRRATTAACTLFDAPVSWIGITTDTTPSTLQMAGWTGLAVPELSEGWHQDLGSGVGGTVAATGQSTIIKDYRRDPRRSPMFKSIVDAEQLLSGISVLLPVGRPAVLYWASRQPRQFDEGDLPAAEAFAAVAGAVIAGSFARARVDLARSTAATLGELQERLLKGEPIRRIVSWLARRLDGSVRLLGDGGVELAAHEFRGGAPLARSCDLRAEAQFLGRIEFRGDGIDDDVARVIAGAFALDLARRRERETTTLQLQADFVTDLLSDTGNLDELAQRSGLLGFDLRAARVVARIGLRPARAGERPLPPSADLLRALDAAVRRVPGGGPLVPVGSDAVVLLPAARSGSDAVGVLLDGVAAARGADLVAGVGRRCDGPADYRRSRADADLAVQIARAREQAVVQADDLKAWQLLAPASDPAALRERAEWVLRPLLDADAAHGRDDLATLRSWLAHDRHRGATAAALFVHENTVRYRLRRIAEVLQIDLQNPDSRFPVELAVRTLELLDATAGM